MSIISVKDLEFSYSKEKMKVLNGVSFSVEKGDYIAVAGRNGSGKSTLAKIICSLLLQDSGSVEIQPGTQIGLVFQVPKEQIVSGVVYRDTEFGPKNLNLNKSEIEVRTIESLSIVDMLHKAKSETNALSLGQTQKIAFSGTIALFPEVLILDEAVSMLDPESRNDIYSFLRYWHELGNTIIHITHDKEAIEESEKVLVLSNGNLLFYDNKDLFFQNSMLVDTVFGKSINFVEEAENIVINKNLSDLKKYPITFKMENILFKYDKTKDYNDIKNISFSLQKGTVTALTGPSGCGKSTILEIASGLIFPDKGNIYSENKPVLALQNSSEALFEKFAVDDVAFGGINTGLNGRQLLESVKSNMNLVNLPYEKFKDRLTFGLSGGEQKRLALAGVLAMNRDVVLFDEPTAGLDGESRLAVLKMLRLLADEGKTVLFSTHKMDELVFADREIKIKNGEIISDSCPINQMENSEAKLEIQSAFEFAKSIEVLRNVTTVLSKSGEGKKYKIQKVPSYLKILLFLILFILVLCSQKLIFCCVMFAVSLIYCKLCGFSLKKLILAGIKILPFLLFFCIFQLIFHPALENEIHFTNWKWFTISPSKLILCINSILRTEASLACICGFYFSIPEYDLIDGLKILLKPLELIRIPVRYFILILEILFRFIPLMVDQLSSIIKLQLIRGGLKDEKSKIKKIKAFVPLFVPLLIQTIKKSEALADAITMRCFK